ncbi:hypothetical protein MHBO_001194 [Bonamia ostreae]|uniref:Uncharacterized protein n=1 Tax=Bonamia ostreae TaxID=126728 RepID=A0ABV2AI38_9EUKA
MHETHCRKRLKKCPNLGCAEMLVLGQPEKHVHCDECNLAVANLGKHKDLYHSLMECGCRLQVERCRFAEHKKNVFNAIKELRPQEGGMQVLRNKDAFQQDEGARKEVRCKIERMRVLQKEG